MCLATDLGALNCLQLIVGYEPSCGACPFSIAHDKKSVHCIGFSGEGGWSSADGPASAVDCREPTAAGCILEAKGFERNDSRDALPVDRHSSPPAPATARADVMPGYPPSCSRWRVRERALAFNLL